MEEFLSSMGVPEDGHSKCLQKIFNVALAEPPLKPVLVIINLVNDPQRSADEVVVQPDEYPEDEGLERVHRDRLEANGVSSSCVICMEEYGIVDFDRVLTRLPCLHLFHAICVITWLLKKLRIPTVFCASTPCLMYTC
ncbi:uncharacterized protein LOC126797047 [Argentina anserina]|uniref:uncharacterized protein LOC126797047 n=1 Tax=Argentina anserina TaxID=57926 RepID=UPI0021765F01|nr:uncharacterized protein LOC126797047 [Potentilla anserina]